MIKNDIEEGITLLVQQVVECRQTVFALVSALGNQPALDRARLSQDFLTAARLSGATLEPPSAEMRALLTVLQAKTEHSPQLSIAERLLRTGALQPPNEK